MRPVILLCVAMSAVELGCGSSSTNQGALDATSDGAGAEGGELADDGVGTDGIGPSDDAALAGDRAIGGDAGTAHDAGSPSDGSTPVDSSFDAEVADVYTADGGCGCQPYWCGCGPCDPAQIACTVNPPVCARGCLSSCPEMAQTTCACNQGRCVRGGIDASSIGCVLDTDCPVGDCCARAQGKAFCATAPNTCCNVACP